MKPFTIWNPTRILFGSEHAEAFAEGVAKLGKKAMIVIGGGSVKKLGYLDQVVSALSKKSITTKIFEGIEPNPNAPTIDRAAAEGKAFGADVIIAIGGGSTMDAAKAIAGLIKTGEKEIWPFVVGQPKAGQLADALPIVCIPTTAATASEVTPYSVVSYYERNEKSVLAHEFFKPLISWINPAFTVDVPKTTTADGAADILSHVFENYLLGGNDSPLADGYTETVIRTVIHTLPKTLSDPKNIELRANLLWASTLALNGYQLAGRNPAEFVLHSMEHALSGYQSNLAHGRGLATLYPSYFRWLLKHERGVDRLARFGRQIFDVKETNDQKAALQGIEAFEAWLKSVGLYQSLEALGFKPAQYQEIANYCVKVYGTNGQLNALGALTPAEIVTIFEGTQRQM